MPTIFEQLVSTADQITELLSVYTPVNEGHEFDWPNYIYTDSSFRRAHLDIVDVRESKKLYMMHLCIFPHINDPSPIFGFDIIAGPNKVTGAFHDFSPTDPNAKMLNYFKQQVEPYEWSKVRELPHWAKQIFSGNMVAASNIKSHEELDYVLSLVLANLDYYLNCVGSRTTENFVKEQNDYCYWQKQNPHTPRVMSALGFDSDVVSQFISKCLFPEFTNDTLINDI